MRGVVETDQSEQRDQKRGRSVGQEQLGLSGVSSVGKPESRLGGEKLSVSRLSNFSPTHQHQARPVWSRHLEFLSKSSFLKDNPLDVALLAYKWYGSHR